MSKVHLVIPDSHAHYKHNNNRALWVGRLIRDVKPDVVINLGDTADMPSLSSYDRGKRSFQGRTYAQDIAAHADFQEKLWSTVRKGKKKLPYRVTLIGNHEQRIERAIDLQPELDGVISYDDLELEYWYDEIINYEGSTPGVKEIDGIFYAHYLVSGVLGRPISGEHPAHSLLTKRHNSCTVGHSHIFNHCERTTVGGRKINGLVAGNLVDYRVDWAGDAQSNWWNGVVICRDVERGQYNLEQVSLEKLKREYSR